MSTSPIQSTTVLQDLAKAITGRFDADGNGQLSSEEFSGFLTSFLGSLKSNPLQAAGSAGLAGAAPSAPAADANRPNVGIMAGFDQGKLADLSHTSTKYQIGRVLQHYPNSPAGLKAALPELQQLVPGVSISGSKGDLLDFGNYVSPDGFRIGVVDVIQSAGTGGVAWQWAPVE